MQDQSHFLFGGSRPWIINDWTASDDRVRGGASRSYFEESGPHSARFHGNLDIETLGGAGFASQRTTTDAKIWNLSEFDGIRLRISEADGKRYTLIIKDELLPPSKDSGRDQATVSYEYDFTPPVTLDASDSSQAYHVDVPWSSFNPTYRGKARKDSPPLDTSKIRRFSIMMRSFFGTQKGPFSISIDSISAYGTARSKHGSGNGIDPESLIPNGNAKYGAPGISSRSWAMVGLSILTMLACYTLYRRYGLSSNA